MRHRAAVLLLAPVIALAACNGASSISGSDMHGDALSHDGSSSCGVLELGTTPAVVSQTVVGVPPSLAGGTIADGDYVLTAFTTYTADADMAQPPAIWRQRAQISGAGTAYLWTLEVTQPNSTDATTETDRGSLTVTGNEIARGSCAHAATSAYTYSATATRLSILAGNALVVLEKQ